MRFARSLWRPPAALAVLALVAIVTVTIVMVAGAAAPAHAWQTGDAVATTAEDDPGRQLVGNRSTTSAQAPRGASNGGVRDPKSVGNAPDDAQETGEALPDGTGFRLTWEPVGGFVVVAVIVGVLFALLLLAPTHGRLTFRRRLTLTVLRSLTILLLFLVMLRPTLTYRTIEKQSAQLFVAIDVSRSMQTKDDGSKARIDRVRDIVNGALPEFADLARDVNVQFLTFDNELRELPFADGKLNWGETQADGDESAIGWTLSDVRRRAAGKRVIGLVMLTDGHQNASPPKDLGPLQAGDRLREFPVFPVVFGKTDQGGGARDLDLVEMNANRTVFVKNQLTVSGVVKVSGFVNQEVPVQLLFETSPGNMEVVETTRIQASRDGELIPVEMVYAPQEVGEFKLTLRVATQPGELLTTNNERSSFVTVLDGGLNVLYVEGALRVEQRFLRRSLDASPDINVDYIRLDAQHANQRSDAVNEILQTGLVPGKYDAYIIGDLDSQAFLDGELAALRECVSKGAGLIMLGGFHTYGAGGYANTPLEDVLPVRMSSLERQDFNQPIRADLHLPGPIQIVPRRQVGQHYLTQIASPEKNASRWLELPPLDGANRLTSRDATVLLETEKQSPLLLAGSFGQGRVLAFGADGTWRWWTHGFQTEHRRFWRQVVLWLAQRDDVRQGKVWVEVDQPRLRRGGQVNVAAGAFDPQGNPVAGARMEGELIHPDGTRTPISFTEQDDEFSATLARDVITAPGDYSVLVKAADGGGELGQARTRFLVYEEDLELTRPEADLTAMQGLADRTPGGQVFAPEEFDQLLALLREAPQSLEKPVDSPPTTLWDKWPIMLMFIALLCTEWGLRKKWGLV